MIERNPQSDQFKEQLQGSLLNETKNSSAIKVTKHSPVYTIGDERETVFFIEKGQIKLVMVSEEGKECMFAIHGAGDVFGELCLSGLGGRLETATAMEDSFLKETLLQIARKLGKKDPRSIRIEVKLSHEELAAMVVTTRPRISVFMQRFRNLDLIEYNTEHHLIIKEKKLTAYLRSIL